MCENIEKTQVVIPRLGQGENLLGAYALEVTGVTKGRGSLFIHTAGAVYMLKSFTGSMEKAQGLAQVLAADPADTGGGICGPGRRRTDLCFKVLPARAGV